MESSNRTAPRSRGRAVRACAIGTALALLGALVGATAALATPAVATPVAVLPAAVPDFAAASNVVYTLDRYEVTTTSGLLRRTTTPGFRIRQVVFDESTHAIDRQSTVMGGERLLTPLAVEHSLFTSPTVKALNALGVTTDGTFYFTSQLGTEPRQPRVDIWKYEMTAMPGPGNPQGTALAPVRVASDLQLNSTGGGTIVGGAVNPRDGAYYFMYFSQTPSNPDLPGNIFGPGNVRAHLYRYYPSGAPDGSPQVGEVAHIDIRKHPDFNVDQLNGDIAFDTLGNLHLVTSNNGSTVSRAPMMSATFDFNLFSALPNVAYTDPSTPSVPTLEPTSTRGAWGQPTLLNTDTGAGYNGFAFTASGKAVLEQGDSLRVADPNTFEALGARGTLTGTDTLVDLASASSPPVLTVQKYVDGSRYAPADQFTLRASQRLTSGTHDLGSVETTGRASGLQSVQLGPQAIQAGGDITVSETISANADNYTSTYECFVENSNGSKGAVFASSTGREVTFNYLADVPGATTGARQMKCVFTNGPLRPDLKTAKSAVLGDGTTLGRGTVVDAGDTVRYRLDFDNRTGKAPATVDHVDHAADVLDDADFMTDSIRHGDGSETGYAQASQDAQGLTVTGPGPQGRLAITGQVPAGQRRTVWFEVTVKANDDAVDARTSSDTGFRLLNVLRPAGEAPPQTCEDDDPNCTDHPISAWTVSKTSVPADGALVQLGDQIFYRVAVEKVHDAPYALEGVQVTDDLTDVLAAAGWSSDDSTVPRGAKARGLYLYDAAGDPVGSPRLGEAAVPAPELTPGTGSAPRFDSTWTLTPATFDLPEEAVRAELWYAVDVGSAPYVVGQWEPDELPVKGTTLTNDVTATSATQPPLRCDTGGDTGHGDTAGCTVTHSVQSSFFTVRKDGVSADGVETSLVGHRFEIRDDVDGAPGAGVSSQMCAHWDQAPADPNDVAPECALFHPIEGGPQDGLWRSQNLPSGTYWLVETRAPEGYQLLAEAVRFRVAEDDGQLQVIGSAPQGDPDSDGAPLPPCTTDSAGNPVACVDETGYQLVITDPKPLAMPPTGGPGTGWLVALAWGVLALGLGVLVRPRRTAPRAGGIRDS